MRNTPLQRVRARRNFWDEKGQRVNKGEVADISTELANKFMEKDIIELVDPPKEQPVFNGVDTTDWARFDLDRKAEIFSEFIHEDGKRKRNVVRGLFLNWICAHDCADCFFSENKRLLIECMDEFDPVAGLEPGRYPETEQSYQDYMERQFSSGVFVAFREDEDGFHMIHSRNEHFENARQGLEFRPWMLEAGYGGDPRRLWFVLAREAPADFLRTAERRSHGGHGQDRPSLRRGRPQGAGAYARDDAPLIAEGVRMIEAGEVRSVAEAGRRLEARAVGTGTAESKAKRLQRGISAALNGSEKERNYRSL